jgi:D-alanine-D-alanine ligase
VLDLRDAVPPMPLPLVIKPVHEGSTIGLFVCRTDADWAKARRHIEIEFLQGSQRVYMIEACIQGQGGVAGRELTVGYLDGQALPVIEIIPASAKATDKTADAGLYDYEAKYLRDDTTYVLEPKLPQGVTETIQRHTVELARTMGVRHLARTDFMLDAAGTPWFLEINTLPGFTSHSLVPMAAKHIGIPMPDLCSRLVQMAIRDAGPRPSQAVRSSTIAH